MNTFVQSRVMRAVRRTDAGQAPAAWRWLAPLLLVLALALGGFGADLAVADASTDANKAVVRQVYAAFTTGDPAIPAQVIDPTWTNHAPAFAALPNGPDGFVQLVAFFRTAFPDLEITVEDLVAEGDRVAARYTVRGTHQGPLGTVPATGKAVEVQAIDLFRVVDGRVTDVWPVVDQLTLLMQIGVIPPAAPAGTPPP